MTSNQILSRLEGLIKNMYGKKVDSRVFYIYDEIIVI